MNVDTRYVLFDCTHADWQEALQVCEQTHAATHPGNLLGIRYRLDGEQAAVKLPRLSAQQQGEYLARAVASGVLLAWYDRDNHAELAELLRTPAWQSPEDE